MLNLFQASLLKSGRMNKIKIILFDVDNVLIRPPHYYSAELRKQGYKNAEEALTTFFTKGDYRKCSEGKADELKLIIPYLQKFGWKKGAEEYFLEQFQFEAKYVDKDLLSTIKKLKKQNTQCYLATDQTKYRAEYILNDMGFKNIFDKHFLSYSIGYRKCHGEFWEYVLKELKKSEKITAGEIAYFDNAQPNVDAAAKFGIKAFLFTNKTKFKKDLASFL